MAALPLLWVCCHGNWYHPPVSSWFCNQVIRLDHHSAVLERQLAPVFHRDSDSNCVICWGIRLCGGYLLLTGISECRQGKGICRRRNCTRCLGESLHQALSMSKQASEWVKEGLSPDTRPGTRGNHPAMVPLESGLMNDKQSHFHGKCWACCFLGKQGDNRNREGFDFPLPVLIWKECLAPCKHTQCF